MKIKNRFRRVHLRLFIGLSIIAFLVGVSPYILRQIRDWRAEAAASIIWDGGGDGVSWSDPLNWDTDAVPVPSDDVLINTASTVNISAPITITSLELGKIDGTAATTLNFAYDSISLGALTISSGDLTIYPSANVTHEGGTSVVVGTVNIDIQTGDFYLYGSMNVNSKGYSDGEGPGAGVDTRYGAGGGAHGGYGGRGRSNLGGTTSYGSYSEPYRLGSGGGQFGNVAGHGGGVIKLNVAGTSTISGAISAIGGYGQSYSDEVNGGGAGGSVWITSSAITGTGSISVDGGGCRDHNEDGGGGGGGRIALHYDSNTLGRDQLSAQGGKPNGWDWEVQKGGAGTIYLKDNAAANGDLIIDNKDTSWYTDQVKVALTPLESNLIMDNLIVDNYSNIAYDSDLNIVGDFDLDHSSYFDLTGSLTTTNIDIHNNAWFFNQINASTTYTTLDWTGANFVDNGGVFDLVSGGAALTIPSGSALYGNVHRNFTNVVVNGLLSHTGNGSTEVNKLDYDISGDLTISASGSINVDQKGYSDGQGPGAGIDTRYGAGGGAYGGYGGRGRSNLGGTVSYGSYSEPFNLGSGGGQFGNVAGHGGGVVKLTVSGTTTIDGVITADGGYGQSYSDEVNGGGAGGSVWITSPTITGTGSITADGGGCRDHNEDGGGGGGGRIALHYDSNTIGISQLSAQGGKPAGWDAEVQKGGAGTIYLKGSAAANGDLIIDNKDTTWQTSRSKVAQTPLDPTITIDNLTINNYANVDDGTTLSVVSNLLVNNVSFLDVAGSVSTDDLTINGDSWFFNQNGSVTTYNTLDWVNSVLEDNGGTYALISGGSDLVIPETSTVFGNVPRTFTNVTVNGILLHSSNGSAETYKLDYTSTGDFTVSNTGSINVDSRGYSDGQGPGAGIDTRYGAGGGAYGGYGGRGRSNLGGTVSYGSYSQPFNLGSGGGQYGNVAGHGGGVVKLTVSGTTTIDGVITADGGYGQSYSDEVNGGGSGGSVWITSPAITGTGSISVDGGGCRDHNEDGGGGGGGRIALHYDSNTLGISQLSAQGGKPNGNDWMIQKGGAGTIYLKDTAAANGDMIIDNKDTTWQTSQSRVERTPLDPTMTLDNLTINNFAYVDDGTTLSVTSNLLVNNVSFLDVAGSLGTDDLTVNGDSWLFNQNGANITYNTLDWVNSVLVDNGGAYALISSGNVLTIPETSTIFGNAQRTFDSLTINGVLTHSSNGSDELYRINYLVDNNLLVSTVGSINVDSRGYSDGNGPGAGESGSYGDGGGAYGGAGGTGQSHPGGTPYGDPKAPDRLGSAGGQYGNTAGHGGGAVKIDVTGTATINGSISAHGGYGNTYDGRHVNGGGSGGSIWISAENLEGTGSVVANGGNAANDDYDGGGGGGGRIALYFTTNNASFTYLTVNGGVAYGTNASNGSVGSVFLGGKSADPINLRQYKSDGSTAIGQGGGTNEDNMVMTFQVQDSNDSDVLAPEVEIQPLGTPFINVATDTGDPVNYNGSIVTAVVPAAGLVDGGEYHWQARVCDADDICSNWVSYGNNTEEEADVRVVMNTKPDNPLIPDSSFYINGQFTNNLQPELGFVLSDPNSVDAVGFQLQVDNNSDFSSPLIDYVSAIGAQGTQSFTVGQAAGDGAYNEGAEAQELVTGDYYWRVKAIDDKAGESSWSVAPGTPSFKIDLSRPTNASNVRMKSNADAVNEYSGTDNETWFNRNDLFFSWDAGTDSEGVKGYCVYLGADAGGDPATQKGLLGTSPISTSGTTCEFITDQTEIDFADVALRGFNWLSSSLDKYYLKVTTIDIANNTFVGPDDTNLVAFYFDNTAPENVTAISAASGTFSSTADMYFTWPTIEEHNGSDAHSGVLGFQYALNSRDTWFGDLTDEVTGVDYSLLSKDQPLFLSQELQDLVQLGQNIIYFRLVDNAGNFSELRTAYINYGGEAPKFSQGEFVTVSPNQNTSNYFGFSWPEAQPSEGNTIESYYYMINTPPPVSYATITSNSGTYIATSENSVDAAYVPGLRKGANTIYVVAVDTLGNYASTNTISATFYLNTELPDPPTNMSIVDGSIKDVEIWRAALLWEEPEYKGTGDITYHIQRSDDGTAWTEIATTTGLSYIDTVDESREYYWRVGTTDNSDESIASPSYSSAVSIVPRGKYLVPPELTSGPAVSNISTTKATITWTTSRTADSKVAFGLASGNYFDWEPSVSQHVTEHEIQLSNLDPDTTYYFRARWTDEDGNTGESEELSFTTEPPPEVKEVRVSNIGVSGAVINFTTVKASSARVYYGTSAAFGGVKEIGTSKVESTYAVQLENLEDGVKYYYQINTFDEEGKEYMGTILDFETLPRPEVYNVDVQQVAKTAQSTLLVSWESNTAVSSVVTYYPEGSPELMRDTVDVELKDGEHKMLVKGLFPDTAYIVTVRGKDIIGNEAVSNTIKFTTALDSRAPQITELTLESSNTEQSGTTTSQLIVSWTTDEPATSQVEYGEGSGTEYSQLTQEDQDLSYNHVVIISGLSPSKVYHLRAISKDSADNVSKSVDTVTITPKATDDAFYLVVTTLEEAFGFLDNL